MVLVVKIYINEEVISTRWCRRLTDLKDGQQNYMYETDDGRVFYHKYKDGAEKLARKLLNEPKETK